jgi:hypothetical protein
VINLAFGRVVGIAFHYHDVVLLVDDFFAFVGTSLLRSAKSGKRLQNPFDESDAKCEKQEKEA